MPRRRGLPTVAIGWAVGGAAIFVAWLATGSGAGLAWSLVGGSLAALAAAVGLLGAPILASRHMGNRRWLIVPIGVLAIAAVGAVAWWTTATIHRHTLTTHDAQLAELRGLVDRSIRTPALTPRPQTETYVAWQESFAASESAAARGAEPALARQGVRVLGLAPVTFGINVDLAWQGMRFCYHPAALGPNTSWVFAGSCADPEYGWTDN